MYEISKYPGPAFLAPNGSPRRPAHTGVLGLEAA
jgi:hypothetical protein